MDLEQKKLLEPFATTLWNWSQQLCEMTPEELDAIEDACNAVSSTNCWYATYEAAQILKRYIKERRHFTKITAAIAE